MADLGHRAASRLGSAHRAVSPVLAAVALWTQLLPLHAVGSPVKPGSAIVHFDNGTAAFADGKFAIALAEFQASMTIEPSPNTRFKIARCLKALGKIGSAYVQFHRAAHEARDRINATGEARFGPTRDAAEAEAKSLDHLVPRMILTLPSPPIAGLALVLDGTPVPSESFSSPIPIDPGEHELVASAPRFATLRQTFSVAQSGKARIAVSLSRVPSAELTLLLSARPTGMTVSLDAKPWPPEEYDRPRVVDPGPHKVEVRVPGYIPFQWQRQLADKDSEQVKVVLRTDLGALRWIALSVGGAAVAALAIGTGFGVIAQRTEEQQIALDPLLRDHATRATVQNQATLATALLTTGGILGGAAIVMGGIALSRRNSSSSGATETKNRVSWFLSPQVLSSGIGMTCLGRY